MKKMLVLGCAAVVASLVLSGCGSGSGPGGRKVQAKPQGSVQPIDPPEKKANEGLVNEKK